MFFILVIERYNRMSNKKVFVSSCYDLLHSEHVEFFRQAAQFGEQQAGCGIEFRGDFFELLSY